ncbi:VC0807 family protein [uncultured Pseudodesulfovibrio sp.]|uniref:VC0807 family protein n=1 Tax=uncultured Pseudodesulfovibrio sp. TaxID=2035858 RepID=UPI0029C6D950|nr:VC0807 family protein [uncultured Pseudodesulfovibrio sp.]
MAHFPVNRMLVGAVAPVVLYYVCRRLGFAFEGAVAASLWSMGVLGWHYVRERCFDGFSGIAAAYAVSELVGLIVTHDPDWYLLSPIFSDCVMGAVFILSLLLPRSLIQVLAEQSHGEAIGTPQDSVLWFRLSLLWGGAYVGKGMLALAILKFSTVEAYLTAGAVFGWPLVAGLIAFSVWYPRKYFAMKTVNDN